MTEDVKQMGCVTISRNGYVQELEEQLHQERELADKLAVELSACNNTWIFNENDNVVAALKKWRELRGKSKPRQFEVGDIVEIAEGITKGLRGTVVEYKDDKIEVSFDSPWVGWYNPKQLVKKETLKND